MRTCAKCGSSNIDDMVECGNCGASLVDSPKTETAVQNGAKGFWTGLARSGLSDDSSLLLSSTQDDCMVSVAVNVRRIFILFLYLVLATVLLNLYALWIDVYRPSLDTVESSSAAILAIMALLGVVLIYMAIFRKKLSKLS